MLRKISISNVALHPLIKALSDDALGDIHSKLAQHNSVIVVDTTGHFKGIICRKDIVRKMLSEPDWQRIPVTEVMITKVLYVPNHVSLAEAAKDMLEADIHQLVVTGPPEGGSVPIGILTLGEVVRNAI